MLYFKNAELAETHHVSVRTVLNWIEAAKQGKLDLTLHEVDGRSYVSNTARNIATIENLVEVRRKYRNTRSQKIVTPRADFYKLFNYQQILDIIANLDIHKEIPRQYSYFNGGAELWDAYVNRLASEETPNSLNYTQQLLASNLSYIDNLIQGYGRVNVVDIGVGNALPVKEFLAHLHDKNVLGRYIGIDISSEMLAIAHNNIQRWFNGEIVFEGYEYDVTNEKFQNLLASEYIKYGPRNVVNIVLLLGGTFNNLRDPDAAYKIVHGSMGRSDLLIHAQKLDTNANRKYFDFSQSGDKQTSVPAQNKFIVDLLNIDESYYSVEAVYDEQKRARSLSIRLKISLDIQFDFDEGEQIIHFNKDDVILVWRAWHQNAEDVISQFSRNEFVPFHVSQAKDQEYILTISRIKHK